MTKNENEDRVWERRNEGRKEERGNTREKDSNRSSLSQTTNSPQRRKFELEPRLHGAFGASSRSEEG
jgi:hypothetical protein